MTYAKLLEKLQSMSPEALQDDVTVEAFQGDNVEYFMVQNFHVIAPENADVLHEKHMVLKIIQGD